MAVPSPLRSTYREWAPRPQLQRFVKCVWSGDGGGPDAEPVLPDGCMDVIWNGFQLFVAGPDTAPVADQHEGTFAVGVRFRPGAAPLFLGLPAHSLCDSRVALDLLWPAGDRLADALTAVTSVSAVASVLEDAVASHLPFDPQPDPAVEWAARRWGNEPASMPVPLLAAEMGVSERQLHRRFLHAVGYGPKRLQRILRFQGFLELAGRERCGLAQLAARCGYTDQAHLSRETAVLAGRTPSQLVASRTPHVRFVQDEADASR